ncbi:MAG TPA: MBL fold metallo-hydrolase, partial [Armatimonadetes bacterium]|nr:MBL fold metallo-hydrolase [Armatimonadota bacterium]
MNNFLLLLLFISSFSYAYALGDLDRKAWIHGSENCKEDQNPALDVYEFSSSTYVLRQNKCSSFEAPFVYVLMGKETTLLLDTGALSGKEDILEFVENLPKSNNEESNKLLVAHTH